MNKQDPSLEDLGLDGEPQHSSGPFGKALEGYEYATEEHAKTWVDSVSMPASSDKFSAPAAAVLSFIFPGAGQIYKLHIISGFCWFLAVAICYLAAFPVGIVLHITCVLFAALWPK